MNACPDIQAGENQGETDGRQQDSEPRGSLDQFQHAGPVTFTDDFEERQDGKDPPGVAHQRFVRSHGDIEIIDVVEEAEVVVDLKYDRRDRAGQRA